MTTGEVSFAADPCVDPRPILPSSLSHLPDPSAKDAVFLHSADSELHTHCNSLIYRSYHTATILSTKNFCSLAIFSTSCFSLLCILPQMPNRVKSCEGNKSLLACDDSRRLLSNAPRACVSSGPITRREQFQPQLPLPNSLYDKDLYACQGSSRNGS